MAADTPELAGLLTAGGVALRRVEGGLAGVCPRCGTRLVVDNGARSWSCDGGCGSGGPPEWVAFIEGVSVSHATELLRAGYQPTLMDTAHNGERTVRLLPPLCAADADDGALLDAVVSHYEHALDGCDPARAWLDRLGVDDQLARRLRIGYANRTLGYRLPEANRKDGATLRGRLADLGVYRASGHEQFTGCLVVPILAAGRVVGLCGYRLDRPGPPLWATGLPGGVFPAVPTSADVLVVVSVRDALVVLAAGREAVVAPGRPSGFSRRDLTMLAKVLTHATVVDDTGELATRMAKHGVAVDVAVPGAPLAELLAGARDRDRALASILAATRAPGAADRGMPPVTEHPDTTAPAPGATPITGDATELHIVIESHRWRVRGADRNRAPDVLRIALSVTDTATGAFHLDTLDLYVAKARAAFLDAAAAELSTDPAVLRRELADVLFATEAALAAVDTANPAPAMSEDERTAALELLGDPALLDRITTDLGALGVVGEQTTLLVTYLATISRKCERPFGVVIQSSSAAGKSTLADAVCALVPEEDLAAFSALTGQALYYVHGQSLANKVLAVAEEQGASRAAYALKLLLSEGRLSIASTGKDPATGRLRTTSYDVAGPVALVLTTTATDIDPELANRLIVLGVDEEPAQTRAIHAAQRQAVSLDGLLARLRRDGLLALHRNSQRLLDRLLVVIPDVETLTFPESAVRHRRDHQKLLGLIAASALLHQHQRTVKTVDVNGDPVRYVEADRADVDLAVRLAGAVLARTGDELAPQTRRVLAAAQSVIAERTAADSASETTTAATFTRRELRDRLGCTEHQIRIALARLIALEYVTIVSGSVGSRQRFTLIDPPAEAATDPTDSGEPRDTSRLPREPGSRGSDPPGPAETPSLATPRPSDTHIDRNPPNVAVDVDPPARRRRRTGR